MPNFVVENNTIYCVLSGFIVLKLYLFTYSYFLMKVISDGLSVETSVCLSVYLSIPHLTHPPMYVAHLRVEQESSTKILSENAQKFHFPSSHHFIGKLRSYRARVYVRLLFFVL
jgi:hypothetical protein